jgi:hypothetical protein
MTRAWCLVVAAALAALSFGAAAAEPPLTVPFDFSRHEIAVNVTVKGTPLFMLIDSGVDPSIVDLAHAQTLGLPVDRSHAGEGSGFGSGKAVVFEGTIKGLKIGGRAFADIETLALDTAAISKGYGRPIDGVLGYSFLKDKTILIDYAARTMTVLSGRRAVDAITHQCRKHVTIPLRFLGDDHWPVIPDFRFGDVTALVTLDTGSSRTIGFYPVALQQKAIRDALNVTGTNVGSGARGRFTSKTAVLGVPVSLGPFRLAAGTTVSIFPANGASDKVIANIGNPTLADIAPELLLDYAGKTIGFYGDCGR